MMMVYVNCDNSTQPEPVFADVQDDEEEEEDK